MPRPVTLFLFCALGVATSANAQTTYTWNPATTGTSLWNTTSAVWSTGGSGGPFDQLYTNGATNNAVLGLTSGTAELIAASTINLGQLRVGSNGFTLTSGGTTSNFTFNQGFQTIGGARTLNLAVGVGATTSFVATGTGDTSAGALTLNVNSAVSGQGLAITSANAFGASPNANIVVGTTTGGTNGGTRVTVATDFTMPAGVSLSLSSSVGADFRSTLASLGGTTTWNGAITLNGGGLIHFESAANNFIIAGNVSSGTAATALQLRGTGQGTVNGVMSGAMSLTKDGGLWRINQTDNTFTGNTTIVTGTLRVAKLADGGATSSLGAASTPITFGIDTSSGAVLEFVSPTASSTNRGISLQGGGAGNAPFYTIRASGTSPTATLTLTGNVTTNTGAADRILILDGTNVGLNTLSGTISSSGGTLGLNKSGNGTWVLSGNNTYTGPTNVTVGTLVINGNQSAATGAVTVGFPFGGPGTLAGTGTIGGAVSVSSGGTIRGDSGTGTGNLNLLADTTVQAGNVSARGNLLTQLSVSGGAITGNSKLALSGANTDLNFANLSGTNTFRITLANDADLVWGQGYTIVLATASASTNFQRNGDGNANALFTTADFVVVSGTGAWETFSNVSLFRDNTNLRLNFTPVPEPASVGLIAAAAGLLAVARRRFTRKQHPNN
jgi:fibronectin-binding autotransporter adhesin